MYFTDDSRQVLDIGNVEAGEDMGVLDLENGIITTQYAGVSKSVYSFPIWVIGNPEYACGMSNNAYR